MVLQLYLTKTQIFSGPGIETPQRRDRFFCVQQRCAQISHALPYAHSPFLA